MVRAHRKKKPVWRVTVSYPFERYSDDDIERLVGRLSSGAGTDFATRDMDWLFGQGVAAKRAAKKLARKPRTHVEIEKYTTGDPFGDPIESYIVFGPRKRRKS